MKSALERIKEIEDRSCDCGGHVYFLLKAFNVIREMLHESVLAEESRKELDEIFNERMSKEKS